MNLPSRCSCVSLNRAIVVLVICFFSAHKPLLASTLSDPAADSYNTRVGTQTFSGLYQFTSTNLLIETAQAIRGMGSENIKMYLGSNFSGKYHTNLSPSITSLMLLAKNEPNCRYVLDMPFRRIIAWAYPFSNPDAPFQDGNYTSTEQANDYREMYDLTHYLLTNYNNSGKTFYLGHWEGDGYLDINNWSTNAAPAVYPAMVAWLNNRQKAIDDAKSATAFSNVNVYGYAEVNRVRDAMVNTTNNNQRAINYVIPFVTNLDYVSYSSYDVMNLSTSTLYSTLDYVEAHMPTNKASVISGERLWIGEYGWGGNSSASQEPLTRAYIQRLLNYGRQALPFILFWEIYDNEVGKNFWLIDTNNVKVPCYDLHQRFINSARLSVAQFKETNGRVPTDTEFVSLLSPSLNQPLPAPVNLTVANSSATLLTNSSVSLSGTLAQGVYGDDCATVWVFAGRQDGGAVRSAWERSLKIGLNTNFNTTTFTGALTNLVPNTNYYFRFYATNSSGEVWAPDAMELFTGTIDPAAFGARMKLTFSGYTRSETLSNFPMLVNLSTAIPGFSYRQFASPIGGDLRFADADGSTVIPHEIDEWNTNGVSTVWVRVPQLSGAADYIWAYWGNPLAINLPSSSTNGAVWSPDCDLVWHLKETGFPFADSAQQYPALSGVAPATTSGFIGHGVLFNGSSQYLNAGVIDVGNAFTLSAWVKTDPTASNIQTIWASKPGGYTSAGFALYVNAFGTSDQSLWLETSDGAAGKDAETSPGFVTSNQWHLLTAVVDRTAGNARLFVDGLDRTVKSFVQTTFPTQTTVNLARFTNSNFPFKGAMDEARIEAGTRSSNWVWATWMTVASNASFATYSSLTRSSPSLSMTPAGGGLSLNWQPTGVGFALYSTTNLSPPAIWNAATNQPVFTNGQWQITLPPGSNAAQFYRLQSQ